MTTRADAVKATRDRICEATIAIWLDVPYDDMTLDGIAERAGTTRQTVLRHFGSKEGLVLAAAEWFSPRIEAAVQVEPGNVTAAVEAIVFQYEAMGDANVRLIEIEDRVPEAHELLRRGRSSHRRWVQRSFSPFLEHLEGAELTRAVDALYAATDVTVWKLLRRDFHRSVAVAVEVVATLVAGVLASLPDGDLDGHRR